MLVPIRYQSSASFPNPNLLRKEPRIYELVFSHSTFVLFVSGNFATAGVVRFRYRFSAVRRRTLLVRK